MKSLVIHHDDCQLHDPGPRHAERPDRVTAILGALRDLPGTEFLPAPKADPEQVLRVHTPDYWSLLVESEPAPGPAAERVALDPDTWMSPGSLNAALRGCGAACFAVDELFAGRARNAFCATRPPGHHAEAGRAMGFCLLNQAAVAARHAQQSHAAERIAILDFDVHHGNGTQAIFEDSEDVLYVSSHQHPLYPGTGMPDERGRGNVVNILLQPGAGSSAFRTAWEHLGLPAVQRFRPDLVILSAGFDGHERDPLAQLQLTDEDYGWITAAARDLAERHCAGRMVSVLEGGYDLEALASAATAHVQALIA